MVEKVQWNVRGPPLNATFPHKKYGLIKGVIKGSWW